MVTNGSRLSPQRLRHELQEAETDELKLRRGVIGLSLLGMAAMTAVFAANRHCQASARPAI
jgi:hypothetical protein